MERLSTYAHCSTMPTSSTHGFGDDLMVLAHGYTLWQMDLVILCLFLDNATPFMHTYLEHSPFLHILLGRYMFGPWFEEINGIAHTI